MKLDGMQMKSLHALIACQEVITNRSALTLDQKTEGVVEAAWFEDGILKDTMDLETLEVREAGEVSL